MLVKVSLLLAIRSLILLIAEKKPWPARVVDGVLFCFFAAFAIIYYPALNLFEFSWQNLLLVGIAAAMGVCLYVRLHKPYVRKPMLLAVKGVSLCIFLLLASFSFLMRFSDDKEVMKVSMTGNFKEEWVEWKQPRGILQRAQLKSYEVRCETPDGKAFASFFLFGEVVGLRAKVIRFHPFLNAIGIDNICQIDAIYNGYLIPNSSQPLISSSLNSKVWGFWETLFFNEKSSLFVKSATLESNYFPLIDPDGNAMVGSYMLTITQGGLSSIIHNKK